MKIATANDNDTPDAGLYTWELSSNTLYADAAVAGLFGLDKQETEKGLPLEAYMDRVYPDDRPALARAISEAIRFGEPFQASYRVMQSNEVVASVLAYGKCFRNRQDEPLLYSGIVFPIPVDALADGDLHWLCLAAIDCAERGSRADVAMILKNALITLASEPLTGQV